MTSIPPTFRPCFVVGTRPEIIKIAPVLKECEKRGIPFVLIHTGQHYSHELDGIFFEELEIRVPDYQLHVGSGEASSTIAKMIEGIAAVLGQEQPSVVLVHGDTNSALAGALAANKCGLPLGHVEAGLRSYDRTMPEEVNRTVIDHVADFLFAPTEQSEHNLVLEGIPKERIHVVGNTVVDAIRQNLPQASRQAVTLGRYELVSGEYGVLTLHRPATVDDPERLRSVLEAIAASWDESSPLLFLAHPRTRARAAEFGIAFPESVQYLHSVGYFDMLSLVANARVILTDSGGLQEEACILGVPCLTLRANTERPETLAVGSNVLAYEPEDLKGAIQRVGKGATWEQPFGAGDTSARIIDTLMARL